MLSIVAEVQKDGTCFWPMFDISAITPLVKWCSYSKKIPIGHFLPSEIEGILLDKIDVVLLVFGKGLFSEN